MNENEIAGIKEAFGKIPRFQNGLVIRFESNGYVYAAVHVSGRWYITGTGSWWGTNVFTHNDFIEKVVQSADKIEVATEWEEL